MRALLVERATARRNPFTHTEPATAIAILGRLSSIAHEPWVAAFMTQAEAHAARGEWQAAYGYARVARYPSLGSDAKRAAYARSRELYLRAVEGRVPATRRVEVAFDGRAVPVYVRVPERASAAVVSWGGIDSFKEERRTDALCAAGWAIVAMDMPGTGEAPISGSRDAERLWDAVFDWIDAHLEAKRIAVIGSSTGGYWAARLAHTRRDRIVAAVDHGGPAHHAFTRDWTLRAMEGEYPFEYAESLALAFGLRTAEEWIAAAPGFSLRDLGILDRPSTPLLVVHGEDDTVFPVADARLVASAPGAELLVVRGGHMGSGDTSGAIVSWLRERLG